MRRVALVGWVAAAFVAAAAAVFAFPRECDIWLPQPSTELGTTVWRLEEAAWTPGGDPAGAHWWLTHPERSKCIVRVSRPPNVVDSARESVGIQPRWAWTIAPTDEATTVDGCTWRRFVLSVYE